MTSASTTFGEVHQLEVVRPRDEADRGSGPDQVMAIITVTHASHEGVA